MTAVAQVQSVDDSVVDAKAPRPAGVPADPRVYEQIRHLLTVAYDPQVEKAIAAHSRKQAYALIAQVLGS
jgi:hypothetical protein